MLYLFIYCAQEKDIAMWCRELEKGVLLEWPSPFAFPSETPGSQPAFRRVGWQGTGTGYAAVCCLPWTPACIMFLLDKAIRVQITENTEFCFIAFICCSISCFIPT